MGFILYFSVSTIPHMDFSSINGIIHKLSKANEYDNAVEASYASYGLLQSNQTIGEICVYYERMNWIGAKVHFLVAHLYDGSHATYRYGPPEMGYFPIEDDRSGQFIAYHDYHPYDKKNRVKWYGNYALQDMYLASAMATIGEQFSIVYYNANHWVERVIKILTDVDEKFNSYFRDKVSPHVRGEQG